MSKLAIVINLDHLQQLQREFILDTNADLGQQLTLSLFLSWAMKRQKQETNTDGKEKDIPTGSDNPTLQFPERR
jgi:hypothetical protein